jgi:hypothetical protein
MRHIIGHARNNTAVGVELINSEAGKSISRAPHLLTLIAEALPHLTLQGPEKTIEHDMGRTIGYGTVSQTAGTETIFYAKQLHDEVYTRFVKNSKPRVSSCLTMHFERGEGGAYELTDVWVGPAMPPRPGSSNETELSRPYWATHAVIFDNQPVQTNTLTKECPY